MKCSDGRRRLVLGSVVQLSLALFRCVSNLPLHLAPLTSPRRGPPPQGVQGCSVHAGLELVCDVDRELGVGGLFRQVSLRLHSGSKRHTVAHKVCDHRLTPSCLLGAAKDKQRRAWRMALFYRHPAVRIVRSEHRLDPVRPLLSIDARWRAHDAACLGLQLTAQRSQIPSSSTQIKDNHGCGLLTRQ